MRRDEPRQRSGVLGTGDGVVDRRRPTRPDVGVESDDGVGGRVDGLDPRQVGVEQLARRDLLGPDEPSLLDRRQLDDLPTDATVRARPDWPVRRVTHVRDGLVSGRCRVGPRSYAPCHAARLGASSSSDPASSGRRSASALGWGIVRDDPEEARDPTGARADPSRPVTSGPEPLLHLIGAAQWRVALDAGSVVDASLVTEGFIHLSAPRPGRPPGAAPLRRPPGPARPRRRSGAPARRGALGAGGAGGPGVDALPPPVRAAAGRRRHQRPALPPRAGRSVRPAHRDPADRRSPGSGGRLRAEPCRTARRRRRARRAAAWPASTRGCPRRGSTTRCG